MSGRGLSIGRLMAVVLIAGLDCGLVRLFLAKGGLGGLLAVALGASAGVIGVLLGRGGVRRFAAGFAVGFPVFVLLLVWAILSLRLSADDLFLGYVNGALRRSPAWVQQAIRQSRRSEGAGLTLAAAVFVEIVLGGPALLTALLCGLAALVARRRTRAEPSAELLLNPEQP